MPDTFLTHGIKLPAQAGRVGIDEVGRGPLAGPVVSVAASFKNCNDPIATVVRDSKKVTKIRRNQLAPKLNKACWVGLGIATVEEINRLGIRPATLLAMNRAFDAIALLVQPKEVIVDGIDLPRNDPIFKTMIEGDIWVPEVSAASIIAKVFRDDLMQNLSTEFPGYGWEKNSGYGTLEHCMSIKKLGITEHHRALFVRKLV